MLYTTLAVAVLFILTYRILARSFIKIATTSDKVAKREYRSQTAKMRSTSSALLHRELSHLLSSPTYMLNCALATPILLIAGVFLLIKGADIVSIFEMFALPDGFFTALLAFGVCVLGAMNDLTAPSVSLEGKGLWIAQSLPVQPKAVLHAKLRLHMHRNVRRLGDRGSPRHCLLPAVRGYRLDGVFVHRSRAACAFIRAGA